MLLIFTNVGHRPTFSCLYVSRCDCLRWIFIMQSNKPKPPLLILYASDRNWETYNDAFKTVFYTSIYILSQLKILL